MIALGLDISTTEFAIATLDDHGDHHAFRVPIPQAKGARRLCAARSGLISSLRYRDIHTDVAFIEIPWTPRPNLALMTLAGTAMEGIQCIYPGAVVIEGSASVWKKQTVGNGQATKDQVMAHACGIGYTGTSQDEADALVMAQCALEQLLTTIGREAA